MFIHKGLLQVYLPDQRYTCTLGNKTVTNMVMRVQLLVVIILEERKGLISIPHLLFAGI